MHKVSVIALVILVIMSAIAIDRLADTRSLWWGITAAICIASSMVTAIVGIATDDTEY